MSNDNSDAALSAPWNKACGVGIAVAVAHLLAISMTVSGSCHDYKGLVDKTAPHYCPAMEGTLDAYWMGFSVSVGVTIACFWGSALVTGGPRCVRAMLRWTPDADPVTYALGFLTVGFLLVRMTCGMFATADVYDRRFLAILMDHTWALGLLTFARHVSV